MANVPQITHAGTPQKRTMTITVEVISFKDDPKIVKIGDMENRTIGEVDFSGVVNGLVKGLSSQIGKPVKAYFSGKTNMLYLSLDKSGDIDSEAESLKW